MRIQRELKAAFKAVMVGVALLCFAGIASAEDDIDFQRECEEVKNIPFPAKDRPSAEAAKLLEGCSSGNLYYGFDKPSDHVRARQCAYIEMDRAEAQGVFEGVAILMMIYANGKGVERNLPLAIKLACAVEGAPAEVEGRVGHLVTLKREKWEGDDFSLCDDITSGFMAGQCESLESSFSEIRRKAKLAELTARWTKKDKDAFTALTRALDDFVKARKANEVDLGGTMSAALQIGEERALLDDFAGAVEKFEKGQLPGHSGEEFARADKELNLLYKKIQKTEDFSWGTVTKEDIKTVQRIWIKYRDAWVVFGRQKYPAVTEDSWKTWLTLKRVEMLEELSL